MDRWNTLIVAVLLCCLGLAAAQEARATTVVPMTLAEMADLAGQAFVGEVNEVRSYWADNPRRIESEVVFQNVQYLKGALKDSTSTFRLVVPGGAVGEWQMRVACAPEFNFGEKWVLFLLPQYRVFPVVGFNQAAFRIVREADGVEYVEDVHRARVTGMTAEGFIQTAAAVQPEPKPIESHNVRFQSPASGAKAEQPSLTPAAFLDLIRPVLAKSKDHKLTQQAGQRDPTPFKAKPIVPHPGNTAPSHASITRVGQPVEDDKPAPADKEGAAASKANAARPAGAVRKEAGR